MDLTVRDVVRLFKVSEKTVYRWIKEKGLVAHKIQDQYRISRTMLLEWARASGLKIPLDILEDKQALSELSLVHALSEGGIYYEVPGKTKAEAFNALAKLVKLPVSFKADELVQLLLARETLASTGVGEGIAIPHVRDPIVLPITKPSLSICFLSSPIDFDAIDGKPVHTFFLLLSTTISGHLQLLARVAYLLRDPALVDMLIRREKKGPLLEKIRSIEQSLEGQGKS